RRRVPPATRDGPVGPSESRTSSCTPSAASARYEGRTSSEVPPVDRSRGLRGQVGLGLTVALFPLDGWDVAEARVQPPVVVGVDPGEDRPAGLRAGVEPVAVHDLSLER